MIDSWIAYLKWEQEKEKLNQRKGLEEND